MNHVTACTWPINCSFLVLHILSFIFRCSVQSEGRPLYVQSTYISDCCVCSTKWLNHLSDCHEVWYVCSEVWHPFSYLLFTRFTRKQFTKSVIASTRSVIISLVTTVLELEVLINFYPHFLYFLAILVKSGTDSYHAMLLSISEFYENRCSESHTLLKVTNYIFPIFSSFF
jgi:hypothetical protein